MSGSSGAGDPAAQAQRERTNPTGTAPARDDAKADGFNAFISTAKPPAPAQRKPTDDAISSDGPPTASGSAPVLKVQPTATARGTASVVSQQVVEPPSGNGEPDWTISDEELESSDILAR